MEKVFEHHWSRQLTPRKDGQPDDITWENLVIMLRQDGPYIGWAFRAGYVGTPQANATSYMAVALHGALERIRELQEQLASANAAYESLANNGLEEV
jgi:hypothetical protein